MKSKQIIQRNLPLNTKYVVIDKAYIPLENGIGLCCSNCGRLIANIATVKDEQANRYEIGFDCLETILINNNLLSGKDIEEYERVKKMIPKILREAKKLKDTLRDNAHLNITGLNFQKRAETNQGSYYPFYWLRNNQTMSKDNDYIKFKEVDFDFMIVTLQNIFPKLNILTHD